MDIAYASRMMNTDEFETYLEEAIAHTAERDDLIAALRATVRQLRDAETTRPRSVLYARGGVIYDVSVIADSDDEARRIAEGVVERDGVEQWPVVEALPRLSFGPAPDEDVVDEAGDADQLRDFGPQMCGPDGRLP